MSSPQEGHPNQDDLLWRAYRFVGDELTAEEVEEFSARLAEDQAAREAVAAAVELHATIHAALKLPTPQANEVTAAGSGRVSRSRWSQRLAWMALGTAACLAAMLIGTSLIKDGALIQEGAAPDRDLAASQTGSPSGEESLAGPARPGELALLWARWPEEPSVGPQSIEAPEAELLAPSWEDEEVELTAEAVVEPAVDDVPSWLVTAVSLEEKSMMPEDNLPAPQEN